MNAFRLRGYNGLRISIHEKDATHSSFNIQKEMSQARICAKIFERNCLHILDHIKHCSLDDLSRDTIGRQLLDVRRLHDGNTY